VSSHRASLLTSCIHRATVSPEGIKCRARDRLRASKDETSSSGTDGTPPSIVRSEREEATLTGHLDSRGYSPPIRSPGSPSARNVGRYERRNSSVVGDGTRDARNRCHDAARVVASEEHDRRNLVVGDSLDLGRDRLRGGRGRSFVPERCPGAISTTCSWTELVIVLDVELRRRRHQFLSMAYPFVILRDDGDRDDVLIERFGVLWHGSTPRSRGTSRRGRNVTSTPVRR